MTHGTGRTGPDHDVDEELLRPYEGWTFATAEDGDLRITEMNRLAVSRDEHAVRQCLLTAIATVKDEDPLDEEFGFDVFEATRSTPFAKREFARVLLHDSKDHDRVETIDYIEINTGPDRNADVRIGVTLDGGVEEVLTITLPGAFA